MEQFCQTDLKVNQSVIIYYVVAFYSTSIGIDYIQLLH